jgi:ADP-ribosylglycohydrolase
VALEELGDGLDGDSALAIGIYASLAGRDYVETVRIAANHDGNSASTAAIAGQLAGTTLGAGAVPGAWVQSLDVCVPLLHQARQLLELGRSLGP